MGLISTLGTWWRQLRWLSRSIMGDSAYEDYCQRHQRVHPDAPLMSEKEFWRDRDDFNESNVQSGCC